MEILWLAIVFYSIGLGIVLQFRPSLMFHENGLWKEFGYQRSSGPESRHTLFPFWLFAIVWAFASYVIAAAITWSLSSPAAALVLGSLGTAVASNVKTSTSPFGHYSTDDEESESEPESEEEEVVEVPVKKTRGRPRGSTTKNPRPGYYVIDPGSTEGGLHRYVYYGETPPPDGSAVKINAGSKNRNINIAT